MVLRSWQVWQWKEEIATLRNMEEENTEPGWLGGVHKYSMEVVVRQLWQVCPWKCGNCHFTQASAEPQMGIQTLLSPQNIRPHTKRDFFGKSNLESVYQAALNSWLSRGGQESRVDSTITRSHSKRQWQPRLSRINVWNSPGKHSMLGSVFLLRLKSVLFIGFNMVGTMPQSISDCWRTKIMKFSSGATNT